VAFVLYLVGLFPSIDIPGIIAIIRQIFRSWQKERIRQILSLLESAKYVECLEADPAFFWIVPPIRYQLEVQGVKPDVLRLEHFNFYSKYAPAYIPKLGDSNAR
jgi:hypothetical protein